MSPPRRYSGLEPPDASSAVVQPWLIGRLQEIGEYCDKLENGVGGAGHYADKILMTVSKNYPETLARAIMRLEPVVAKYETGYNESGVAQTTRWEAALGTIVHLSCQRPDLKQIDWQRMIQSIAFFASVEHSGQHHGFGKKVAEAWKESIKVVRPKLIKPLNALIEEYCKLTGAIDEATYRSSGGGQMPQTIPPKGCKS